jgi:broad specificity phosphatase PhoE
MRKLLLIKHARPQVDPNVSSEHWTLSEEGREKSAALAQSLREYDFASIISSSEPKAVETAEILGKTLAKPVRTGNDLFEHDRSNVPHMESREFISMVALFFKEPNRLVLGNETADEAYDRFAAAVDEIIAAEKGDVAIVTHGTVLALFAQRRAGQDPFTIWRRMGLPSFMAMEIGSWKITGGRDRV